jgi:hypothetical protein
VQCQCRVFHLQYNVLLTNPILLNVQSEVTVREHFYLFRPFPTIGHTTRIGCAVTCHVLILRYGTPRPWPSVCVCVCVTHYVCHWPSPGLQYKTNISSRPRTNVTIRHMQSHFNDYESVRVSVHPQCVGCPPSTHTHSFHPLPFVPCDTQNKGVCYLSTQTILTGRVDLNATVC